MSIQVHREEVASVDWPIQCAEVPQEGQDSGGVQTILLVDDDLVTLTMCSDCLQEAGYVVLRAKSSEEALHICKQYAGPIHLLLTDVVLAPQKLRLRRGRQQQRTMSGIQLMHQVLAARPQIHVIFMSGHSEEILESLYLFKRGDPFLKKPFSLETLVRLVRESLSA